MARQALGVLDHHLEDAIPVVLGRERVPVAGEVARLQVLGQLLAVERELHLDHVRADDELQLGRAGLAEMIAASRRTARSSAAG
jgi:hypothetical protein